jgi:hypothetical protein
MRVYMLLIQPLSRLKIKNSLQGACCHPPVMLCIKMLSFESTLQEQTWSVYYSLYPRSIGGVLYCATSVRPFVQDIFRRIFLSNFWWQKSNIWSQASYMYAILWEAFLNQSYSYFLFADLVVFHTHCTYMRGVISEL